MASDNWKRETWARFAGEVAAVGVSLDGGLTTDVTTNATLAHHCGAVADALLSEVEQREREGRFEPMPRDSSEHDYHEAVTRMHNAEAEAERLKAEPRLRTHDEALRAIGAAIARADKAESLLKEVLGLLSRWRQWNATSKDPMGALDADTERSLARARQEGFSDGE